MSGAGADGPFEVAVEPCNDRYGPDGEGWQGQVATLYADLDAQVGAVRRACRVEGAKGAVDQLIIALGSAVVLGAVGGCLRARLGRDRDRCINVRYHRSSISRRSSRNYLDGQGRSRTQEDEKNLIFRSGSSGSHIASVPKCSATA
jgi:hypothetical protein